MHLLDIKGFGNGKKMAMPAVLLGKKEGVLSLKFEGAKR
jgi:hypothetical protein